MNEIRLEKREGECLIIQEREYQGKKYVDFRIWFNTKENPELKPTKKGFTLSPEKFEELRIKMKNYE